jgi:hypothetical protein
MLQFIANMLSQIKKYQFSLVEPAVSVTDSVTIRVIRDSNVVEEHSSQPTKKMPPPI